jgi:Flp pilus assembly protein TadD
MQKTTAIFANDRGAARAVVARFRRQLARREDDADLWHALGLMLSSLGDRAGACAAFRAALALDGTRRHSQRALGNLLFDSCQWDHALRCFELAEQAH